jgi:hypothetical protein
VVRGAEVGTQVSWRSDGTGAEPEAEDAGGEGRRWTAERGDDLESGIRVGESTRGSCIGN